MADSAFCYGFEGVGRCDNFFGAVPDPVLVDGWVGGKHHDSGTVELVLFQVDDRAEGKLRNPEKGVIGLTEEAPF